MASIVGNDISSFQSVDWATYKDNSNFVIIKATEGVGFTDPQFLANQSGARSVGLPLGYYNFARPDLGNIATDEANYFLQTIGTLQEGEILALDYEVTYADPVTYCKEFLDAIQSRTGVRPLIYLNQSDASNFDWTPVINASYGLWIAAYTYDPAKNDFNGGKWQTSVMQQWTDQQDVPGINGNVDGDVFFGDINAFKNYGYHAAPQPDPCADSKKQVSDLTTKLTTLSLGFTTLQNQFDDYKKTHPDNIVTIPVVNSQNSATTASTISINSPQTPFSAPEKLVQQNQSIWDIIKGWFKGK